MAERRTKSQRKSLIFARSDDGRFDFGGKKKKKNSGNALPIIVEPALPPEATKLGLLCVSLLTLNAAWKAKLFESKNDIINK